jgi:AmiR/NasT family two-component response regulator
MADYLDGLSESLAVLHELLQSEESPQAVALAPSITAVRVDSTELVQELSQALESRAVIEQAKGMLMTRLAYNADEASDLLELASRDSHQKMIVLAQRMVHSASKARHN